MKKVLSMVMLLFCGLTCFMGCGKNEDQSYLRIHIRANSNLSVDQNIKYLVKDEVVNFLAPLISEATSFEDVKQMLENSKLEIESVCNNVLKNNGFCYTANAKIATEYFPTRAYGQHVLQSDFYDALIIELGNASGDNWWCVVYPPLCFLNATELNSSNIKYKSKLVEIVNNFFD